MRKIEFKESEISSLIEIIKLGNSQYENEFTEIGELILSKIRIEIFTFSAKEIQVLKSYSSNWLNNNDESINELIEKYCDANSKDNLIIESNEIEKMKKIEIVFSIKSKLFKEKYGVFRKVLEKNIETI